MPTLPEETAIVRASQGDAATLSTIASAAKAHWGYPASWLAQWAEALTITPETITAREVFKAIRDGTTLGFYSLQPTDNAAWQLDHLWVLPSFLRQGIGSALFAHAVQQTQSRGARRLMIESDPHAEGFYLQMGAYRIGTIMREIDGRSRTLPLLARDLSA